jgi:hypothetical protein
MSDFCECALPWISEEKCDRCGRPISPERIATLPQKKSVSEKVEVRAEGVDGVVTANELEISIKFKGLGRITHGGDESYPMEKVKAVGYKEPPGFGSRGHIQFGVLDADGRAEANSTTSGWIFGSIEHMVMFDKKSLKDFIALKEFVELQIKKYKSGNSSKQTSQLNIADELGKLAKLKESGILTDEEFQIQKKKLLS